MRTTRIAAALVLLNALPAAAQQPETAGVRRSNTSKLFVEAAVNRSAISLTDLTDGTVTGSGIAFQVGYGFSPTLALFLDASGTYYEGRSDYLVGQVDLGLRYHFAATTRAIVPYLEGSITGLSITPEVACVCRDGTLQAGTLDFWGSGFSAGGGLLWFFSPRWALNSGVRLTRARMTEVTMGNVTVSGLDMNAPASHVTVGVAWFPMKPR